MMEGQRTHKRLAFAGLSALFFMWGFITVMNDVLINTFGNLFNLSPTQLSYIQLSFFGTFFIVSLIYFILSSTTGYDPINKIGYKQGMGVSLIICALGCGAFYLAGLNESYPQFIAALFVLSVGVTLLQICANPYATILGPSSSASSRLNLAQGLNSLGTTVGPIIGSILIYNVFSDGTKSIASVGQTYLAYGLVFAIMGVLVFASKLPAFKNPEQLPSGLNVLKFKHLRFGILAIFCYVGSEVSIGSWLGTFAKDPDVMGMGDELANYYLAFFWGGLMIGRLMASISLSDKHSTTVKNGLMALVSITVFGLIWTFTALQFESVNGAISFHFSPIALIDIAPYLFFMLINYFAFLMGKGRASTLLVIFFSINFVLMLIGILAEGYWAFWAVMGTGLFFSVGWSNIFSLSLKGLGNYTSQGSALLVMAIVGGAVLPPLQSNIIENADVQTSFIIPLLATAYLIYFGLYGYRQEEDAQSSEKSV